MGQALVQNALKFLPPKEIDAINGPIPYYAVGDEAFPLLVNLMKPFPGRGKRNLPLDKSIFNYRLVLKCIAPHSDGQMIFFVGRNVIRPPHLPRWTAIGTLSYKINFKFRLSRSRRTIENTFGIMASKWRIFRKPIIAREDMVNSITKATIILHNFIKKSEKNAGVRYHCSASDIEKTQNCDWTQSEVGVLAPISHIGSNMHSKNAKIIRNKLKDHFSGERAISFQYDRVLR